MEEYRLVELVVLHRNSLSNNQYRNSKHHAKQPMVVGHLKIHQGLFNLGVLWE
jgi:hypothetical protein